MHRDRVATATRASKEKHATSIHESPAARARIWEPARGQPCHTLVRRPRPATRQDRTAHGFPVRARSAPPLPGSRPGRSNQAKSGTRAGSRGFAKTARAAVGMAPCCFVPFAHAVTPRFVGQSFASPRASAMPAAALRGSAGVPIADGRAVGSCWPNKISGIRIQMLIMTPCKTMETETCPNRTMYMQVCVRGQPDRHRRLALLLISFYLHLSRFTHAAWRSIANTVRQEPLSYRAIQRQLQPLVRALRRLHHLFFSFITPLYYYIDIT